MLAILRDRRRSQRGSVLSAVLILTAFLAIVSGAVYTEVTSNFLAARSLTNRVATEATVNSAVELSIDQLQSTALTSAGGCPAPGQLSLNLSTAVVTELSCAPVVDHRSLPLGSIVSANPFTIDGTHSEWTIAPGKVRDDYLVGDANAVIYNFPWGQSTRRWSFNLGGTLTGPPASMLDQSPQGEPDLADLVPVAHPNDSGVSPSCGPSGFCVALLAEDLEYAPTKRCFMPANGSVVARPASAINFPDVAYFGDTSGTLFAYATMAIDSGGGGGGGDGGGDRHGGDCALVSNTSVPLPIVAGPVVFRNGGGDEIYVVESDGSSSALAHFRFDGSRFRFVSSVALAAPNAVGLAVQSSAVPARIAVTFAGGQVGVVQIAGNYSMSALASTSIGAGIASAPYWCHCPAGDRIGVGGLNGSLHVFDGSLSSANTFPAGGPAISRTPVADRAGDWFAGADDGNLYVGSASMATLVLAASFGSPARIGSSPLIDDSNQCAPKICIYMGAQNGAAFLVPLDARKVLFTACLSSAPPACSGQNPRLWAQVEVGDANSPRTVHVLGWSYYST